MIGYEQICKRCGESLSGHRNLKYCPSCAKDVHRAQARECSRRYRMRASSEEPMDWLRELSEGDKTTLMGLQRLYGEHFVQIANEKIRQVEQLVDAGLV